MSRVRIDRSRDEVVWRMPPDVADFYAEDVLPHYLDLRNDQGVREDAEQLRAALVLLHPEGEPS